MLNEILKKDKIECHLGDYIRCFKAWNEKKFNYYRTWLYKQFLNQVMPESSKIM